MDVEDEVVDVDNGISEEDEEYDHSKMDPSAIIHETKQQNKRLERLKEKDPEFYQFLLQNDKEIFKFSDDDFDESDGTALGDGDSDGDEEQETTVLEEEEKLAKDALTTGMVDSWCKDAKQNGRICAVRSLLKAFRVACHHGDDASDDGSTHLRMMSSNVFNKVMSFVLSEMDGVLKNVMKLPPSGGNRDNIMELKNTKRWKKYGQMVKSYLGNSLHVLNQMTDSQMISYTLRRLTLSSVYLAAFPSLLRKYIKVVLHFWCTGGGDLPVASLRFLMELCKRFGPECTEECVKGIYKAYVLNCQFVNAHQLQHVHFLANCVIELLRVNLQISYVHAFSYIRQLAMVLRDALNTKTRVDSSKETRRTKPGSSKERKDSKKAYAKVYAWKYINCLELWTGAICAYAYSAEFRPLAYPLTQIIYGVARLVPSARYFPLRLRCAKMLNRIAAYTNTFIPVSMLLLDMLDMKELSMPPKGGIGEAVDIRSMLRVKKQVLMTRSFQEACVTSVVEQLAQHLAQWSYSPAFFELSFIPLVRLRAFAKCTKVDRFRRDIKQLVHQIEANTIFVNEKRALMSFLANDPALTTFLEEEKKSGASPLSKHVATLSSKAQQRDKSLKESSVVVGTEASVFKKTKIVESDEEDDGDMQEGAKKVFSSSWLPAGKVTTSFAEPTEKKEGGKKKVKGQERSAVDEDIVEDLVMSSDEDESGDDNEDEEMMMSDEETPLKNEIDKGGRNRAKGKKWNSKVNEKKPTGYSAPSGNGKPLQNKGNQRFGYSAPSGSGKPLQNKGNQRTGYSAPSGNGKPLHNKGKKRKRGGKGKAQKIST